MSSIASLLTGGPAVSAQGNRGKASSNSQNDGEGFAKQLSENKTTKGTSTQNPKNNSTQAEENNAASDIELSTSSSQFADKIRFDYEFKSDAYPTVLETDLNIDELELSLGFDIAKANISLVEVFPDKIAISSEDLPLDFETPVLMGEVEAISTDQEILAVLNTQLSGKTAAGENIQKTKPPLNGVNSEIITPNANSSVISAVTQIDVPLNSTSADSVDQNKVITKNSDAAAVTPPVQNIDAAKANNTQNVDAAKLPTNASVLANLANGDGLSDKGADHQKDDGSHQFANQVDKAGIKVEGVNVLEARVFPAISSLNGTNISGAILKTHQLSGNAALQNADSIYNISQPKMINTLKIQLVPANLGVVTAVMKLTGEELQVQLQVDNVEAYRKLSADSASIVNTLKNQGFAIEQVNVQLMSGDKGSAQQGQQQNGQSFQGQAQQEASSGFDRDRRDSNLTNSNEQNQELSNNESDILQAPQVPDLSNGVYL